MASGKKPLWIVRRRPEPASRPKFSLSKNLNKSELGGVIFGCTNKTIKECFAKQLFGLPASHMSYVQNIEPGLPLFLFNYDERNLHGIFEAASCGRMNINPYGWTFDGSERSRFPAQVQVRVQMHCQPLPENKFKPAIADNYYKCSHFHFELNHIQTSKLISLLSSVVVIPTARAPLKLDIWRMKFQSLPSTAMEVDKVASAMSAADENNQLLTRDLDHKDEKEEEPNELPHALGHQDVDDSSPVDYEQLQPMKLNELAQCGDSSVWLVVSTSAVNAMQLDGNVLLIQCMEELKASNEKQSQLIDDLEKKMFQAERVIQQLKNRCMMLESKSNSSMVMVDKNKIDTSEELRLDSIEKIFLLGGYDGERWLPSLDSYHPSQNVVRSLSPMNVSRSHVSVAWLNGELYAFGGAANKMWYDTVESYNVANDQWVMCPSMSKQRGHLAGASLNGKLFALGGGDGTETFADVEMLDLDIGRWVTMRSMVERRFGHACLELNGALYVSGGYDGAAYLKSAEMFDPRERSWRKIPSMRKARGCHSVVALDEKLYAFGGCNKNETLASTEIFDPRLGTWMPGEPMNRSRAYASAAVVNDTIYVIGGLGDESDIVDVVEGYVIGRGWQETTSAVWKRCYLSAIAM